VSIESSIVSALAPLVQNRVYPDIAPQGVTALPRITYQQISGEAVNFMDPTKPSRKNARIQVNVWAGTRLAASSLGRQVEDTLRAAALQVTVLGALTATYESDTNLYGTLQDFSFWFTD
jgi:hypothetical protein